ncbi:MAG: thioredoxin family protein [Marinilabiliales bacterium]|nr:thioredoxin family protein [Marinilabiliales bacterium]
MKKWMLTCAGLFFAWIVSAQQWETDFAVAKSRAEKEGKIILLNFSGSDWCIPCMKLEKSIWESPEFGAYAQNHLVLLRADFPKRKANALSPDQQAQNDKLAETYNRQGLFPLVLLLDKAGKVLGTTGYKSISPVEYVSLLQSLTASHP